MKKKNKIWLWVVFSLLFIIGAFFAFRLIQQTFINIGPTVLYQWTSTSCGQNQCDWLINGQRTIASSVELSTKLNTYKFDTSVGEWGSCGTLSDGTILGGCCVDVKVYKNTQLIDTIKSGYQGTKISENSASKIKQYFDDGTSCDTCDDKKTGVLIQSNMWSVFFGSDCRNVQNAYQMRFANDSVDIEYTKLNTIYYVNDTILGFIKINSKLPDTIAILKVKYKVSTIIGDLTKDESYNLDLKNGDNIYNFSIPSNKISSLDITPTLEIYYPSTKLIGVNYQDKPVSSSEYIKIGEVTENTTSLNLLSSNDIIYINNTIIINQNVTQNQTINNTIINQTTNQTLTCEELNCPINYNCKNKVCILKEDKLNLNTIYLVAGIFASILTIGSIVYVFVRKRK